MFKHDTAAAPPEHINIHKEDDCDTLTCSCKADFIITREPPRAGKCFWSSNDAGREYSNWQHVSTISVTVQRKPAITFQQKCKNMQNRDNSLQRCTPPLNNEMCLGTRSQSCTYTVKPTIASQGLPDLKLERNRKPEVAFFESLDHDKSHPSNKACCDNSSQ